MLIYNSELIQNCIEIQSKNKSAFYFDTQFSDALLLCFQPNSSQEGYRLKSKNKSRHGNQ